MRSVPTCSNGAGEEADRVVGHGAAVVGQLAEALLVGADEGLRGRVLAVGQERGADVDALGDAPASRRLVRPSGPMTGPV